MRGEKVSIKDVQEFYLMVEKDQTLKKDIEEVDKKYKSKEIKWEMLPSLINKEIIPIAKKKGLVFSSEEFINYLKEKNGLAEEDLSDVIGGLSPKQAVLGLSGVLLLSIGAGIGTQFIARSVDSSSKQQIEQRIDKNKKIESKTDKEKKDSENKGVKGKEKTIINSRI